jgi:hypothetical protein
MFSSGGPELSAALSPTPRVDENQIERFWDIQADQTRPPQATELGLMSMS